MKTHPIFMALLLSSAFLIPMQSHAKVKKSTSSSPQVEQKSSTASIKCKDGSISSSKSTKGACSGHGGVAKTQAPASMPENNTNKATKDNKSSRSKEKEMVQPTTTKSGNGMPPSGATAKCKDGSFSTSKQHSGACSHHGGIDKWL